MLNTLLKEIKCSLYKNTITKANILAGDYSYYDAKDGETFEDRVLHHYEFLGDRLIIGKFCCIANGVTFIMNGANHRMDGFSAYPFNIFEMGGRSIHLICLIYLTKVIQL